MLAPKLAILGEHNSPKNHSIYSGVQNASYMGKSVVRKLVCRSIMGNDFFAVKNFMLKIAYFYLFLSLL